MKAKAKPQKHWMEKAFSKHKGALHRALGVPEDEKIPHEKLVAEAKQDKDLKLKRRALAALNAQKSS